MIKIRIRDFQSIAKTTVEVDGFTVVTGGNNIGKSALVRALRGAFQNTKGTWFVRKDAKQAVVEIDLGDGHTLYWSKGPKSKPTYKIDGGKALYPGQAVPEEVRALDVRPIQAGGREIWPQFAPQFKTVFLLDEPGSVLAEAIADVERVGHLNQALKMAESDRRAASSRLKVRREDRVALEEEVARFEGVDDIVVAVETIEAAIKKAQTVQRALETLSGYQEELQEATETVEHLSGIEVIKVPDGSSAEGILREIEPLQRIHGLLIRASEEVDRLSGIEAIEVPGEGTLRQDLGEVEDLGKVRDQWKAVIEEIERLSGIEEISASIDSRPAEKLCRALDIVLGIRERRQGAQDRIRELEALLATAERDLEGAEGGILEMLGEAGECPVCGSVVEHEGEACRINP